MGDAAHLEVSGPVVLVWQYNGDNEDLPRDATVIWSLIYVLSSLRTSSAPPRSKHQPVGPHYVAPRPLRDQDDVRPSEMLKVAHWL
jgi:hypothetical protein